VSRLAETFYDAHPDDPRRWRCVQFMAMYQRTFAGPTADADRAAWFRKEAAMRDALAASDAPAAEWTPAMEWEVQYALAVRQREQPADLREAGVLVDRIAERAPGSDRRVFVENDYLNALDKADPEAEVARERMLAAHPEANAAVAGLAEGRLRVLAGRTEPLELKFTAADGRAVDTAALRGKVVMIDFWATWCVPCMKEMPNVVAAYGKYHDKGFEVIGVSFDRAPGARPGRTDKTAEQVVAFANEHGMPWPQYYDGKYWSNDLGLKYSIREIPANFLLDKTGRIAAVDAYGAGLDAEVSKLLGP
jgi:thiol-disulfide isomerase/thioredoxin